MWEVEVDMLAVLANEVERQESILSDVPGRWREGEVI